MDNEKGETGGGNAGRNVRVHEAAGGDDRALLVDPLVLQEDLAREAQREYDVHVAKTTQLVWKKSGDHEALKLKEPRQLFSTAADPVVHAVHPRWPTEVPCVNERPRHIHYTPQPREAFYNRKTDDFVHNPSKPYNKPKVVYTNVPGPEPYFVRSRTGPSPSRDLKTVAVTPSPESETLVFESRFECGNLQQVYKVGPYDYELYLRPDLYTKKHTQWFYFRFQNTRANTAYRLTIMNLLKPASLYNEGLKPVFYSEKDAGTRGVGWVRNGAFVSYYKNSVRRPDNADRCCHSLSWTFKVPYSNDTCYFAHCYPYSYTDLQDYLRRIAADPVRSRFCRQRVLCQTIAGNYIHILTISSPSKNPIEAKDKRAIVVTARVHPGETNGSWMMKGFLDFICGSSSDAKILRDCFVFKVIPMLNPDGVVVGNYRCSLAARDLNRNYRSNYKEAYPGIWNCREMVKRLLKERDILLYCDFHGHSRKNNVFIYGCENRGNPLLRFHERIFPLILDKTCCGMFQFDKCHFRCQKSKEGTGRIVMWRQGILNSFTMEATFCGSKVEGPAAGFHFHSDDLESMGSHFCNAVLDYCDPNPNKVIALLEELAERHRQRILERLAQLGRPVPVGQDLLDLDMDSDLSSDDGGSDSSGSDGDPVVQPLLLKQHMSHRAEKRKRRKARRDQAKAKAKVKLQFESKRHIPLSDTSTGAAPKPPAHSILAAVADTSDEALPKSLLRDIEDGQPSAVPLVEKEMVLKVKTKGDSSASTALRGCVGAPPHTQERIESRSRQVLDMPQVVYPQVAPQADLNAYLTSITNEYIRQGLLITDNRKDLAQLVYTNPQQRSSQILRHAMTPKSDTRSPPPQREPRAPNPPKAAATTSVIDLPHRPPSPPSFTSQFLANQLKGSVQQSQALMGSDPHGEFQPVLSPAPYLKNLTHRGSSKSTGALNAQQHSAATGMNLGHKVAGRYDRSSVDMVLAEHRKQQRHNPAPSASPGQAAESLAPPMPQPPPPAAAQSTPSPTKQRPKVPEQDSSLLPVDRPELHHKMPGRVLSNLQVMEASHEKHKTAVIAAMNAHREQQKDQQHQQQKQRHHSQPTANAPAQPKDSPLTQPFQLPARRNEPRPMHQASDVTSNRITLEPEIPASRQGPRKPPAPLGSRLRTSEPGSRPSGSLYQKLSAMSPMDTVPRAGPVQLAPQERPPLDALSPAVILLDVPNKATVAAAAPSAGVRPPSIPSIPSIAGQPRLGRPARAHRKPSF